MTEKETGIQTIAHASELPGVVWGMTECGKWPALMTVVLPAALQAAWLGHLCAHAYCQTGTQT